MPIRLQCYDLSESNLDCRKLNWTQRAAAVRKPTQSGRFSQISRAVCEFVCARTHARRPMPKILLLVVALAAGTHATGTICANDADFDSAANTTMGNTTLTCANVDRTWKYWRGSAASDAATCAAVSSSGASIKAFAWAAARDCCGGADSVCGAAPNICANKTDFKSTASATMGDSSQTCANVDLMWMSSRGNAASDAAACDAASSSDADAPAVKTIAWLAAPACCGGAGASACGAQATTCDSLAACNGETPGTVGVSAACYQAVGGIIQSGQAPASWAACNDAQQATVPTACQDAFCSDLAACPGSKACSLPPAPAGMVYQSKVTFAAVVAGTVADFDQTAFKNNMASLLGGVDPADISLTVTAASVRVVSVFTTTNQATAATAAKTIATYDSTTISAALKVTVETVEAPTVAVEAVTAPPPSPSPPPGLEEEATMSGGGGRAQPSFLLAPFMLGLAGLLALA